MCTAEGDLHVDVVRGDANVQHPRPAGAFRAAELERQQQHADAWADSQA
jgi:hypothetical protein